MSDKIVEGFYDSLRKSFFALRLVGVFPITGLLNRNSKLSRCSWIHPYTLFYVTTITCVTGFFFVHLCDIITNEGRFKAYGGLLIHALVSLALIFIMRLSFNWRKMMDKIDGLEKQLPPFKNGQLVVKTINRVMLYVALFALVDYILSTVYNVRLVQLCLTNKPIKEELTVEKYYRFFYTWYLNVTSYNFVTTIWLEIIKIQATFIVWYIDALVIAVTLYLIFRFRNFNRLMRQKIKKCNQNTKWCDVQAHYTRLTRLVKVIDDEINPFVFLSFLASLVFTCKIIYDFIHSDVWIVLHKLSSATVRLFKALSVSILTSHLHTLSREPLQALHTLPAPAYNFQVIVSEKVGNFVKVLEKN
nr:uncharacterized protein LOC117981973 [Maniola hyperantus]